jgi:hypothetical protein
MLELGSNILRSTNFEAGNGADYSPMRESPTLLIRLS